MGIKMQKVNYIETVIKFIESNLTNEINPELTAQKHYVSLSQLYRDFYSYTGHSIKEYIRKRRISNACERIKCSDLPLSIIANNSGCQTQQAFNKLFKSIVGMTPLEYKQSDTYYYFYPYPSDEISIGVKVSTEIIPECDIYRYFSSCLHGIEDKAISEFGNINFRIFGRNGKQISNKFCYEIMTEKQDGSGKSNMYATCIVNYCENEINDGWNYLYNIWLPKSMFEQSDDGYFEEYLFKNNKPHKLKLYLPVKKRKTTEHIMITQIPDRLFIICKQNGINAEHKASEKVINYISEHYPLIISNARNFYVCAYDNTYECGIECDSEFKLTSDSGLEVLHISKGEYAVLADECLGDIRVGAAKIEDWLRNNSITHENKPVFAVYETPDGKYNTDNIKLKLYKLLKNDKNG